MAALALARSSDPCGRRQACGRLWSSATLLASVGAATTVVAPAAAAAQPKRDKLRDQIQGAKTQIEACPVLAKEADWAATRRAVSAAVTPLTMKGYTGESVKSLARSLEGSSAGADLASLRLRLLRELQVLDVAGYAHQLGQSGLEGDEYDLAVRSCVVVMDELLVYLDSLES